MGKRKSEVVEQPSVADESMAVDDVPSAAAAVVTSEEPKKKKSKKEKTGGPTEEELAALELCPIAHPLASAKMGKKVLKTVKKGL